MKAWLKGGIIGLIMGIIIILYQGISGQNIQSIFHGLLIPLGIGILLSIFIEKWYKGEKIINEESLGKWGLFLSILTLFIVPYFIYFVESSKLGYSVFISLFIALISLILCIVQNKKTKTKTGIAGLILSIILLIIFGIWALIFLLFAISFQNGQ